jgi:hypothetical protein
LITSQPAAICLVDEPAGLGVDPEQTMPVRPGAGASAPGLDAEQVVEQGDHEVVVEVAGGAEMVLGGPDHERDDREPLGLGVAQDPDGGFPTRTSIARRMKPSSRSTDLVDPHLPPSANTSPARIDSTMAGVPPSSRCSGSAR